jgi:hypothetical protein
MNSYSMSAVLSAYLAANQLPEELAEIIGELATEGISTENFHELRGRIQMVLDRSQKEQVLDLIIYYIRSCIRDHELSDAEKQDLQRLLTLFRVKEGEFYRLQRNEITDLLTMEVSRLILDGKLEKKEDLYQTELQRLLGLSYDQYVELTRGYVLETLDELIASPQADPKQILFIKTAFLISGGE